MIASLDGKLVQAEPPTAVVSCGGVGYEVWLPLNSFATLPAIGQQLHLYTHLVVRDDAHILFGFPNQNERSVFKALIGVSGIGPKSALGVMSELSTQDLAAAVGNHDVRAISKASGIGPKSAERIIVELRGNPILLSLPAESPILHQAQHALVTLGYKPSKARLALASIKLAGQSVSELVTEALQQLSGGTTKPKRK